MGVTNHLLTGMIVQVENLILSSSAVKIRVIEIWWTFHPPKYWTLHLFIYSSREKDIKRKYTIIQILQRHRIRWRIFRYSRSRWHKKNHPVFLPFPDKHGPKKHLTSKQIEDLITENFRNLPLRTGSPDRNKTVNPGPWNERNVAPLEDDPCPFGMPIFRGEMLVSGSVAPPFFCLVRTTPTLLRPFARSIIENGYPSLLMNAHHDSHSPVIWSYNPYKWPYKWVSLGLWSYYHRDRWGCSTCCCWASSELAVTAGTFERRMEVWKESRHIFPPKNQLYYWWFRNPKQPPDFHHKTW